MSIRGRRGEQREHFRHRRAGVFRRTLPPAEEAQRRRLTRVLGLDQLTLVGVGAIIGAGIFSLAGAVAKQMAGPAVLVSVAFTVGDRLRGSSGHRGRGTASRSTPPL